MKTLAFLFVLLVAPAWAADKPPAERPSGTLIDFRVEVQRQIANDLGHASAFTEVTSADPAEVARKVKTAIAEGIILAKAQQGVTVKSGNTHTWPIYGKGGRNIEGWRMRSELLLESRDAGALSAALGKLQSILAVGNLQFAPAPETRRQAEDDATIEAIANFNAKAARIAASLKKPYRIRQMSVAGAGNSVRPYMLARDAMKMSAEAAPMPIEAGESSVTVSINGQIELVE